MTRQAGDVHGAALPRRVAARWQCEVSKWSANPSRRPPRLGIGDHGWQIVTLAGRLLNFPRIRQRRTKAPHIRRVMPGRRRACYRRSRKAGAARGDPNPERENPAGLRGVLEKTSVNSNAIEDKAPRLPAQPPFLCRGHR
jgi:hypothetical protein